MKWLGLAADEEGEFKKEIFVSNMEFSGSGY